MMPESLQIFDQSLPSHHQMPVPNVESQFNWLVDSGFPPPGIFGVTDHFPSSEFAGSSFPHFSSSSVDELSKVTEQKRSFTKRKIEFDDEVEGDFRKRRSEEDAKLVESKVKMGSCMDSCSGNSKPTMDPKLDYIYVKVRRGQATDSHSLAERARREKIKKKMQYLQDIVPGCDKITNKAAKLDQIINYVQWLQRQVEFLTMKLAESTASLDFKMENMFPNEFPAYIANFPAAASTASPGVVNPAHQYHGSAQLKGASSISMIEMPIAPSSLACPVVNVHSSGFPVRSFNSESQAEGSEQEIQLS